MQTDSITWGETYDIRVQTKDLSGDAIVMDETYQAACRVTRQVGGESILDPAMVLDGGAFITSIDTGDAPWKPGTYFYDIRITDPEGNDYWSEPVRLTLRNRNTPNT